MKNLSLSSKNILSKSCIFLVVIYWVFSFTANKRCEKNPIVWDVVSYYGYLPAVFIYKDITLHFTDKDPNFFVMKYWPEIAPNGGRVIKTSMGVSFLYAPFFFLGHLCAGITREPQDGFSVPYQVFLQFGTLFYLIIGFIFLQKFLLNYFSDKIAALVIFSLFFGTNILYYATREALMPHVYVFAVSCVFIWATVKWHRAQEYKISVLLGLATGWLVMARPTLILFLLFPLLYGVTGVSSLKDKIYFLKKQIGKLVIIIICFILVGIPQLLYWKYITGDWIYFSYTGERFFWNNPHILWGLFSYRNGWLVYTPLMAFSLMGIFFMREKIKSFLLPMAIMIVLYAYAIHSWWCWWHGGFGLRAYIDIYGALAIPLASFYDFVFRKRIFIRISILVLVIFFVYVNIFQTWQYERGLIGAGCMTKKSYWLTFLKTEPPATYYQCLQEPDIDKAKLGLPDGEPWYEDFPRKIIHQIDFENPKPGTDTSSFTTGISLSGKHSFSMKKEWAFSPSLTFPAKELLDDTSSIDKIASVSFYSRQNIGVKETLFSILFKNDSGIYFYNDRDFYCEFSERNKWTNISLEIPTDKIKDRKDSIHIYVWCLKNPGEVFIDDLKCETVYKKE